MWLSVCVFILLPISFYCLFLRSFYLTVWHPFFVCFCRTCICFQKLWKQKQYQATLNIQFKFSGIQSSNIYWSPLIVCFSEVSNWHHFFVCFYQTCICFQKMWKQKQFSGIQCSNTSATMTGFFFPLVFWEKPKLFNILTKYYFTSQPY